MGLIKKIHMWRKGRIVWNEKMSEHMGIRIIEGPQVKLEEKAGRQMYDEEEIYRSLTENEILEKLAESRTHAEHGLYRDADEVLADVRAKYGL